MGHYPVKLLEVEHPLTLLVYAFDEFVKIGLNYPYTSVL
jgi:hypothetical protein